ncbi:unnamed protein product [Linum tenue]|uniref:Transmembrane protein n=1 Tax=Linum tenue TaxID=586396 RepID=A0AAV0L9E0_9ROSI|nr:unnamed protein product [Linum tenue]
MASKESRRRLMMTGTKVSFGLNRAEVSSRPYRRRRQQGYRRKSELGEGKGSDMDGGQRERAKKQHKGKSKVATAGRYELCRGDSDDKQMGRMFVVRVFVVVPFGFLFGFCLCVFVYAGKRKGSCGFFAVFRKGRRRIEDRKLGEKEDGEEVRK